MKHILLITLFVFSTLSVTFAQTKKETKLYEKSIAKGDLKSLDKFLEKYPQSTYSPKVTQLRDSIIYFAVNSKDIAALEEFLINNPNSYYATTAKGEIKFLNTTVITPDQAITIAKSFTNNNPDNFIAYPYKLSGTEYILIVLPSGNSKEYTISIIKSTNSNDLLKPENWTTDNSFNESIYTNFDKATSFSFDKGEVISPSEITLKDGRYIRFGYINKNKKEIEYISSLIDINSLIVFNAMYGGKLETEGGESFIEGTCYDSAPTGPSAVAANVFLVNGFNGNEFFKPVSKEKFVTDSSIEWWYKNNKKGAKTLKFGSLETDHPLVTLYKKQKIESGAEWDIAKFDTRDNTLLVARNKARNQYYLVWCEPQVKNKKTEAYISTIYFERGASVALFYYKGNQTFKRRINLASKVVR